MRSVKKVLAVCAAATVMPVFCALTLRATRSESHQDTQQNPVIRSQVSLVNLFVTVRDKNKRIVTDLK